LAETVTCPFCSLHCTGLHLEWDGDRLNTVWPACVKAEKGYRHALTHATFAESAPGLAETVSAVQPLLHQSQRLAVVLCSDLPQEVVPAAVAFCKKQSAFLVTDDEFTGSILSLAVKEAGVLSASLGELRDCISQVVCCGRNILQTLPRLEEFLPVLGSGQVQFLPEGRPLIALQNLRLEIRAQSTSLSHQQGVVLFDRNWLQEDLHTTAELLGWLADLNGGQRWYGLYAPPAANSLGICNALITAAGCPGNMHLSPAGIEYDPRQFQLHQLISSGWIDTCLIAGSPDLLSASLKKDLEKVTTILLNPEPADWEPTLTLPVARAGVDCTGTMQRLDYVPISLQPLASTSRLPIETVFHSLSGRAAA
jgi:formylmethanofuran dehydrogenase subunit B